MFRNKILLLISVPLIFACGCTYYVDEPLSYKTAAQSAGPSRELTAEMFSASSNVQMDSIDDVIRLKENYESLIQKNAFLANENSELKKKNADLEIQLAKTQSDLESAQNEIAQANEFMTQMNQELIRWKSDVLGYRDENRKIQKAQLEALSKILKVLGAQDDSSNQMMGTMNEN